MEHFRWNLYTSVQKWIILDHRNFDSFHRYDTKRIPHFMFAQSLVAQHDMYVDNLNRIFNTLLHIALWKPTSICPHYGKKVYMYLIL